MRGKKSAVDGEEMGALFEGNRNVLIIIVVVIAFDGIYQRMYFTSMNVTICK